MIKLLILDADTESIKNFKTYLRISFPMLKTVYTLSSRAGDVTRAIAETRPDLIVADIRFFGASAHKIIRSVSETFPEIKFILYGTYNDAEYLKKAMEYGVLDYLYRPVKPADFKRSMERALNFFDGYFKRKKEKEEMVSNYKKELGSFQDLFFASLISGVISGEAEIERALRYFGFAFSGGYTVFTIRIDHFKKIILTLDETDKHLLSFNINAVAAQKIKRAGLSAHSFITGFNAVTCVLSGDLGFDEIFAICDEIKDDIFYGLRLRVTVGLGRTYQKLSRIHVSFNEAASALRYRFYMGHNTVIPITFVEPHNFLTYAYPYEQEEKLVHTAVIGEFAYCEVLLERLFGALKNEGVRSSKLYQRLVMNILFAMSRYALEQNSEMDIDITGFFSAKDVSQIKNAQDAYKYLRENMKRFCEHMTQIRAAKNKKTLDDAKAFINERYFDNISVAKLALALSVTPEFLNKLFFDNEKMTATEFIVLRRIGEAKKILSETPDIPDEQVAQRIGYDDVKHFKGLFRQKTGTTTADYRQGR